MNKPQPTYKELLAKYEAENSVKPEDIKEEAQVSGEPVVAKASLVARIQKISAANIVLAFLISGLLGLVIFERHERDVAIQEAVDEVVASISNPPIYMVDTEAALAMMMRSVKMGENSDAAAKRYSELLMKAMDQVRLAGGYVFNSESIVVGPVTNVIGSSYLKRQDELLLKEGRYEMFGFPTDSQGKPIIKTLTAQEEAIFSKEGMEMIEKRQAQSEHEAFKQSLDTPSYPAQSPAQKSEQAQNALRGMMQ